jgi:excisionase family DNA binding protein
MSESAISLWRIRDVAKYFGVSRQTVHRWMARKVNPIPHFRPGGGAARFDPDKVIEWATTTE